MLSISHNVQYNLDTEFVFGEVSQTERSVEVMKLVPSLFSL
jgi:hypothetical protein